MEMMMLGISGNRNQNIASSKNPLRSGYDTVHLSIFLGQHPILSSNTKKQGKHCPKAFQEITA